jgi:hypothetical protein
LAHTDQPRLPGLEEPHPPLLVAGPVVWGVTPWFAHTTATAGPLYRAFAELDAADREAVRVFASKYGQLGVRRWPDDYRGPEGHRGEYAETALDWGYLVATMRGAVQIKDLVRAGDGKGLAELFELDETGAWTCRFGWRVPTPSGDIVSVAAETLAALASSCLPSFGLALRTDDSGRGRGWELGIAPGTLHAALWLQFCSTLVNGTDPRKCPVCGTWFEVRPADHRVYCTDACRMKDYRRRKAAGKGEAGE